MEGPLKVDVSANAFTAYLQRRLEKASRRVDREAHPGPDRSRPAHQDPDTRRTAWLWASHADEGRSPLDSVGLCRIGI